MDKRNSRQNKKKDVMSNEKVRKTNTGGDQFLFQQLNNHHREIDLVLDSNFDEGTKQQMIEEIQ